MTTPSYMIQGNWQSGKGIFQGYVNLDEESVIHFVSDKNQATQFESRALANGWLFKIQSMYPTYKIILITL